MGYSNIKNKDNLFYINIQNNLKKKLSTFTRIYLVYLIFIHRIFFAASALDYQK